MRRTAPCDYPLLSDGQVNAARLGSNGADGEETLRPLVRRLRRSVIEPVLSVLFPPRCVGCGEFETYLCSSCRATLEGIGSDSCPRCGEPGPVALVEGRCAHCMGKEVGYAGARAAFRHQGVARRMVADLKFGGQLVLARLMAELARPALLDYVECLTSDSLPGRVVMTWVPCHSAVQRRRGYNQAQILAQALAEGLAPMKQLQLVRKITPTKQQKGLGRAGREANLRGAFTVDKGGLAQVSSKTEALLLVDDVYTTGATAKEVSTVLVQATGLPVYVFTFSRAVSSANEKHD